MVDIHCHILPGLDDGSDNIEESVRMARLAADGGTKAIIVTPHSNIPDSFQNYCGEQYIEAFTRLESRLRDENIPLRIYPGHEIFASGDIASLIKERKLFTLCNSDYLLIEFAFRETPETAYRKLRELVSEGFVPVVAHPERYAFVADDDYAPLRMKDMGCLIQVNKGSLKGSFGRSAYMISHSLIRHRFADFVASDAHSPYMRTPYLADAHSIISDITSVDYADRVLNVNPSKILKNEKII